MESYNIVSLALPKTIVNTGISVPTRLWSKTQFLVTYFAVYTIVHISSKIPYVVAQGLYKYVTPVFPCSHLWQIMENAVVYSKLRAPLY